MDAIQRMVLLIKFSGMENPFKLDDKVLTKIKGTEVEVTVRLIWNNEVQVKCPDDSLRWRTAKTVWFPPVTTTESPASDETTTVATSQPASEASGPLESPAPSEPVPEPSEPATAIEVPAPAEPTVPAEEPAPSAVAEPASGKVGGRKTNTKRKKRK